MKMPNKVSEKSSTESVFNYSHRWKGNWKRMNSPPFPIIFINRKKIERECLATDSNHVFGGSIVMTAGYFCVSGANYQ